MNIDYKIIEPIQGTSICETFISERETLKYSKFCEQLVTVKEVKSKNVSTMMYSVSGVRQITDYKSGCQRLIFI